MFEFFAAFANHGGGVNRSANAAADLGQVSQDALQVRACRRELCGKQLVGKRIRRHAATASLTGEAVVGVRSDVDNAVARCHRKSV